jgi:hypothetical protein
MKKIKYLYAAIITAIFAVGCSSPVHVQKDDSVNLKNYKTYMWVDTHYSETDNKQRPTTYADIPVRNAANAQLRKAGWNEVTDNPDILVSYDVLVEKTTARQSDPVYTQSFTRTYYNPRARRWSTIYYPSQFAGYNSYDVPVKEGTITITLTDATTDKIVWQGWTSNELNYSRLTEDEITSNVKNIFDKLDIASR